MLDCIACELRDEHEWNEGHDVHRLMDGRLPRALAVLTQFEVAVGVHHDEAGARRDIESPEQPEARVHNL